ncbi:MAG: hypothetical protein AAF787_09655 [Chloroflexota bacterium]
MQNRVFYSPLALKRPRQVYHMPVEQAQYPSLGGQCAGKTICDFTIADIHNTNKNRTEGQK